MSITNNNPFLLNIQPVQGSVANSTGIDPITTLRSDVDDIQQMVNFGEKRISVDVISGYNQTKIQVINDINVQNSILSVNDIPVIPSSSEGNNNNNTIINNNSFISVSTSLSYGLFGISSLSSIVSYGLSTVYNSIEQLPGFSNTKNEGVSSLSSIVAYGLSSIYSPTGLSSLSSIVSYGLSTVAAQPNPGISSLSSIIAYGLSSIKSESGQFVGANTWVSGFYPSSIGGADIYNSNTGNPDSVTNALAKLDSWIYKNIVDQPTAPSYFGKSNSISSINYYWTNPQQFKIGILNIFSPYISSLHMDLYSNVNPIPFSSFTYSSPYTPNSEFTVEGVDFISSDSNSDISVFQNPSFANKNTLRISMDSKEFNIIKNGSYFFKLYFRNFSSNSYKILDFGSNNFIPVGIPEPPQSISFTNISLSNAFIEILKPSLHSVNPEVFNYPPLSNYKITLCNIAPSRRYTATSGFTPSIIFEESNYPYIAPLQSNSLNNTLLPDSKYIATVKVKNIINEEYSAARISPSFDTLLPDQPETLTSITTLTNGLLNTELVFGNISNVLVYNRNTFGVGGIQFTTNSDLGIQSSNNPGSSGASIASITLSVSRPNEVDETNTLNLDGFPIVSATRSNSNANTIIQASNIRDFHSGNIIQRDFFMSFTANAILRQSYLTASSNSYTFSMIHSNSGFNCNVSYSPFYIDDLDPGAPSLLNIGTSNNSHRYFNGVPTFRNFVLLNFDLSNLARYFYVPGQSLLSGSIDYKGSNIQTITYNIGTTLYTTGDVLQTAAPLSNVTRIKSAFTIPNNILTEANSNGSRVVATVSLSNLNGSSGSLTSNLPFYIDTQSIRVDSILGSSRIPSGGGSNSNDNPGIYRHEYLIRGATGAEVNYNFELPFVGGLFRTGAALSNLYDSFSNFQVPSGLPASSYSNLSNYSLIKSETGIRYATFRFNYSAPNTSVYINKVTVNFSNQSGLTLINSNYDSSVVRYFSLFSGSNGFGSSSNVININEIRTNVTPFENGVTSGIVGTRLDFSINSNSRTVSIIPYNSTGTNVLYIKIGLTMNCNVSFQNFNVAFGSNFAPPRPANVTFTNNNTNNINNLTLRWQTPVNCNSPLDNYTFNIIPSCNNVYPRRWVQSGSRIIQEPYFSNVICNVFVPDTSQLYPFTQYEFTRIASNYDTPYTGSISLTNDAATSETVTSEIVTPLPANSLPEFTSATNLDLNAAFKTYYPFCNAFNLCSRTFVTNILSNQGTPVVIDYLVNGSISNAFSINNSNNTGTNLSIYSYTGRWFKDGTATPSATTTFQFSNQLYLFSNTSGNRTSPTVNGLTLNINQIQDVYTSGLATGFYLKAYPNLQVNSFSPGRYSNSFSLSNSDGLSLTSVPFYIDDISIAPSIDEITFNYNLSDPFDTICGIRVLNSYGILTFFNKINNLAKYYFRSNCISWKVLSNSTTISNFNFNNSTTPFYINNNNYEYSCDGTNLGALINPVYFKWSILLNYDVYTPVNSPYFVLSACNLIGSSPEVINVFGYQNKNILIDSYSIKVKSNTENSNWSNTGCNYGIRVESGGELYPTVFGSDYDHTSDITRLQYLNELQLTYGAYRTTSNARFSGASNGYLNYRDLYYFTTGLSLLNYGNINFTGKRYVTFKWFINSNISRRWRSANIAFDFDDAPFSYDSTSYIFPGIDIHYKIVASNQPTPTQANLTTAWLNANAITSTIPTNTEKITDGHPCGFYYTGTNNDSNNLKVFFPSGNYSNVPFNVFVRIGMPMNSNVSLRYCRLGLSEGGIVPGQPQNLSITNANSIGAGDIINNTTMSWTTQNDTIPITGFQITYAAISNDIFPRRYRTAGRVTTESNTISSNVSINGVATTSTYLFTPSNFDTFYYGSVIASNLSGNSVLRSNISANRTPLFLNSGLDLDLVDYPLKPVTTVNYLNNGILFSSRTNVSSNEIYASNLLFTQGGSVRFVTIDLVSINDDRYPASIGDLSRVTWNVSLSNLTTRTSIKNCNYTFSNELFAGPQTIVPVNDGSINWTLLNVNDLFLNNDPYKSGFFATTEPIITLSNTIIPPSSNRYRLSLNHLYLSLTNSNEFYVENLVGAPSGRLDVENISGINRISFCNISGVSVITSTRFNFWINTTNIGSFFFYNPPVTASNLNMSPAFAFNSGSTTFYWNNNSNSSYTRSPISNTTYFYWSNVSVTNSNFGCNYPLTGTVNNISNINIPLAGSFTPYFDFESVANMNCNLRVNSGPASINYPQLADGFGSLFDNNTSLTGNDEIQFVNGVYCTKNYKPIGFTDPIGYKNYDTYFNPQGGSRPFYDTIGSGGRRFVSLLFSNINPSNTSNKLNTVTLRFVYNTNGVATHSGRLYNTTTFQVRLDNNSNPTISNNSTAWLNANAVGTPTLITKNTNNTNCLNRIFDVLSDGYMCHINIPPGCGYCNMNLYTRVGFDMSPNIALRRIELISTSNTVIIIPSQFNANLYINSNGTRFDINLLPNLPVATYCNLSASFVYNSVTFNASPSQAITSLLNYNFTNFSFSPNVCNVFATGSFVIRNNGGTNFYTSNTIQSIDYLVARPNSAAITFSPGVWSSNSNYFVGTIQTPNNYPNGGAGAIVYYTVSNDTRSFTLEGNRTVGIGGSFSFSNLLTSDQYLKRAFYMTTYVEGTMRDSSTRLSSNLIAGSNGILTPPTGHSNSTRVVSFNSATGVTLIESSNFYNSQIFTLPLCNASYGFQSFSNAGFPRSIYGYCNDPNSTTPFVNPNRSNAPITFPFTVTCNLSVYDTFYNAYLYLVYSNGSSTSNTSNFVSTARTGLPSDTRSNWLDTSIRYTGTTFPNAGQIAGQVPASIQVFRSGFSFILSNSTNIAVNSLTNPGNLNQCNYTLSISNSPTTYTHTFSNSDYEGTTRTFDTGIVLTSQDYSSGRAAGFYLSFNLSYNYLVTGGNQTPFNPSITFNSIEKSTNIYIGDDPGTIGYTVGPSTYTSNIRTNYPVSITDLGSRLITFINLTRNSILPFNFGSITFSYNTCNNPTLISATQSQGNSIITGGSINVNYFINNPAAYGYGINIIGINSIVNYQMINTFRNIASDLTSNISDSVFNDTTNSPENLTLLNGDLKWLLGAWRADYSTLNFNSNALRATFGNSSFVVGPGTLRCELPLQEGAARKQFRISASSTTNVTNVIADFPRDPRPQNSGFGYGTFDCRVAVSGIDTTEHTGGCGVDAPNNNVFTIYTPTGYVMPKFYLWITVETGSVSNVILNY